LNFIESVLFAPPPPPRGTIKQFCASIILVSHQTRVRRQFLRTEEVTWMEGYQESPFAPRVSSSAPLSQLPGSPAQIYSSPLIALCVSLSNSPSVLAQHPRTRFLPPKCTMHPPLVLSCPPLVLRSFDGRHSLMRTHTHASPLTASPTSPPASPHMPLGPTRPPQPPPCAPPVLLLCSPPPSSFSPPQHVRSPPHPRIHPEEAP
jgi:hypothetical protein